MKIPEYSMLLYATGIFYIFNLLLTHLTQKSKTMEYFLKLIILDKSNELIESIARGIARLKVSVKRWEEKPTVRCTPSSALGTLVAHPNSIISFVKK